MSRQSLIGRVARCLSQRSWRLATAEACTGGELAAALTAQPGSSAWYDCGLVCYSDASKTIMLDVPPQLLSDFGAVSEPVVAAMTAGLADRSGAQASLALSGIAGPGGARPGKPVGTVCFAWRVGHGPPRLQTRLFAGDRHRIREQALDWALQGLLTLLDSPGEDD